MTHTRLPPHDARMATVLSQKRAENAAHNAPVNTDATDLKPFWERRICQCPCRRSFDVPPNSRKLYFDDKCRSRRFDYDRRRALYDVLKDLFRWLFGASRKAAKRRAQEAVKYFYTAWLNTFKRMGYRYVGLTQTWVRIGASI